MYKIKPDDSIIKKSRDFTDASIIFHIEMIQFILEALDNDLGCLVNFKINDKSAVNKIGQFQKSLKEAQEKYDAFLEKLKTM